MPGTIRVSDIPASLQASVTLANGSEPRSRKCQIGIMLGSYDKMVQDEIYAEGDIIIAEAISRRIVRSENGNV